MTDEREFGGRIGGDWRDSEPWWPPTPTPPAGAPNVVLIVLDDVGFAQLGCYGSDIDTPVLDGLSAEGIRLTNFHTTALCSPTRACLLTGRNHHRNGMGRVADLAIGFPGYWGKPPRENGFLSEILQATGYATYAVGKWHLSPEDETNMAGSRGSWPLGRGFDRWYGFHGGETHQFMPALYHDNHAVRPPRTAEEGYHLSADLADRAIEFLGDLRAVDADKPFFLYFCTGACHSPHHAPREWIERYKGKFSNGWDSWREETFSRQRALGVISEGATLSPRPEWVPSWEGLGDRERALAERFMESFAAYLSYTDQEIGRLLAFLDDLGDADNTLVMVVSDNGASSEGGRDGTINEGRLSNFDGSGTGEMYRRIDEIGGPSSHNNYPWGWTMAGNTPFRRWKREVHEGGIADPCIVRLPTNARVDSGGVRRQFAHAIDVMPTVLELAGIGAPEAIGGIAQSHLDGTSFAYLLTGEGREAPGRHVTQHFEMLGSRAIYHDGWKAVTFHPVGPLYDDGLSVNAPFDEDVWELFFVEDDPSETEDLAGQYPEKVRELVERWWVEARKNDVLPLDNRVMEAIAHPKPDSRRPRDTFRYFQGGAPVPETVAVKLCNRPHLISVAMDVDDAVEPSGVLVALGCALGGWSFHVLGGRLRYVHNLYGRERHVLLAERVIGPGRHSAQFRFETDGRGGGTGTLLLDDETVAEGTIDRFTPAVFNEVGIGLTCGYEWGPAVGEGYTAPFAFNGGIIRAEVTTTGPAVLNPALEIAAILAKQ